MLVLYFCRKFFAMKKVLIAICIIALAAGCSSSDTNENNNNGNGYNRTEMLTNWADNIIIPAYQDYTAKVTILSDKASTFTQAPTTVALSELRTAWLDAYIAYQSVALYDFGKAADLYLKQSANTFPTNTEGIEANITSGTYNLNTQVQFSKQGFPGIDYLINGVGSDAETVAYFGNANAAAYLVAIANQLKTIAQQVTADWTGNYRDTYVANNGTSVTSSVNKTTNNFIKNLEKDIRSGKLGIPAGLFSNGVTYADKVEAFYKNDVSKTLLNVAIKAEQDFFNGKAFSGNATGASLKSALDAVNTTNLSTTINNQFDAVYAANNALSDSFSDQVTTDNTKMITAYNTLQQGIVYIKLDMMQALNITIDYVDGDGD
jgi:hypothetical protein